MNDHPTFDLSRRSLLRSMVGGSMLLPGIVSQLLAEDAAPPHSADPLAPKTTHFSPKAKRVIFLFMSGGVSHVDSWDDKPKLFADAGKTVPVNEFQGRKGDFNMFLKRPQWDFAPHGQCGTKVSSLFPHMAECVDDLCVIRSMKSDHTNHYEATLGIHTGSFTFARPSLGSWVSYGLGTVNRNLPSFVVIAPQFVKQLRFVCGGEVLLAVVKGDDAVRATVHDQDRYANPPQLGPRRVVNRAQRPHRQPREELRAQVGYEAAMICNEKDYLATRTAYKLYLRGPALNIYTACSTSLVAALI